MNRLPQRAQRRLLRRLSDDDVRNWFDMRVPKTRVPRHFIERALARD